jgi:hypothetical protein
MNSFRNPFPEAGVPEYPPAIPLMHAERGETIHVAKRNFSSKILNFIAVDKFPVNVILVMGSYGSGKTKLAYNTIYELYHPNEALGFDEQSIIFADIEKEELRREMAKTLMEKKPVAIYLTFESAFMKKHTLNNVVSVFRSALEELQDPEHEPNRRETLHIPEELREKIKTLRIDALRIRDILELLKSYFHRIFIFVDEFERFSERGEVEQKAIVESIRDDFINLFSTSDFGTLLIINYTPAIGYLITPSIERRGRSIETGRFSYQTAKKVLSVYLQNTEFIDFFGDDVIFSAYHLARDAGSQFLQICGEALIRASRSKKSSIGSDDLLYAVRVVRGPEGQKLFSEAYYASLKERLSALDPVYSEIFDYMLGLYFPRDIKNISKGTGFKVENVRAFVDKFSSPSETFKDLLLITKCYFLDRTKIYRELESFSKAHGTPAEALIDILNKMLEIYHEGRRTYIVPNDFSEFRTRIGLTASEELHKGLKEKSDNGDRYILSTEVLNNLVAAPVGYEDVLDLIKGQLKGEVRSHLVKPRSIYEREKEAESALYIVWKHLEE